MIMVAILALALAIIAIFIANSANERHRELSQKLGRLSAELQSIRAQRRPDDQVAVQPAGTATIVAEAPPEPTESQPQPTPTEPIPDALPAPAVRRPAPPPPRNWEKALAENWLVWLGGVTVALGGAFLVKLSIDAGLLTPLVRIVMGLLLGVGLIGGGDWLARRERSRDIVETLSYVPPAMVAAGASTVFASLYAAYALYDLLPSIVAFLLLALTAIATVAMSLRHGAFVAGLGFVGALTVPAMVASESPSAMTLFSYLTFVTAGMLAVLRVKKWWWLAWVSLGGAVGWVMIWLASAWTPADAPVLGGFLILQGVAFVLLRRGAVAGSAVGGVIDNEMIRAVLRVAVWALSVAILSVTAVDDFGIAGIASTFAMTGLILWLALRDPEFDDLLVAAGMLPLALLAIWGLIPPGSPDRLLLHQSLPQPIARFLTVAGLFALALGVSGFAALSRAPRPARWAALSAAAPLALLVISYLRLESFNLDLAWTVAALALAAINLWAADWAARKRAAGATFDSVLAAYAVGVLGATIVGAAIGLERAWLTVALALHLPAIGWVDGKLKVSALRQVATAIAAAVLIRLIFNPEILRYPISTAPIFNWLLYGYGVPAVSFIVAVRQFRQRGDDALVSLLETGGIAFSVLLATFELRHAVNGVLDLKTHGLARDTLQSILWLSVAVGLLRASERPVRDVWRIAGILLALAATIQTVMWQALFANPLTTSDTIGTLPILNALLPAYAIPGLLYAYAAHRRLGPPEFWKTSRALAVGFAFLWLTLEIRHAFRGERIGWGSGSESEWYAYSVAWLFFSAALLSAGLIRRAIWLRRTGLMGIGLVAIKVFASDTADLSGIWRALSFLGLGATLLGIGYAYRRMGASFETAPQGSPSA